ncbi:MAG: T9SS type A sorting domain-containing protein [Chitinophagaceae bacterium]|nr:T9SS type A sorting domain-containing protein [Chitinophagaceae bacterium]
MIKKPIVFTSLVLIALAVKANISTRNTSAADHLYAFSQPSEILNFSAELQNGSVFIQWSGFRESSTEYFAIERSVNARNWDVIATIKDEGNGSLEQTYSRVDAEPLSGQSYYRLKEVDQDGTGKYSKTIAVYYSNYSSSRTMLPTDSTNSFLIKKRSLSNRSMTLFNATGHRVIFDYNITDNGTQINLKQMPDGEYTLRINRGIANPSIIKLVKNKR